MSGASKPGTLAPGSGVVSELGVQGLLELITAVLVEVLSLVLVDSNKSNKELIVFILNQLFFLEQTC